MLLISVLSIAVIYWIGVVKTEHTYSSYVDDKYMLLILALSPFAYFANMYIQDFEIPYAYIDLVYTMYIVSVACGFSITTVGMLYRWVRIKDARPYNAVKGFLMKPCLIEGVVEETKIVEDKEFGRCLEIVLDNRISCRFTRTNITDVDKGRRVKLSGYFKPKKDLVVYARVLTK